jgi:hypothetical protein
MKLFDVLGNIGGVKEVMMFVLFLLYKFYNEVS